jgi:hypothetical protein
MPEEQEIEDPKQDNPQEDPKKDSSTEEQSKETHIETENLPEKFKGKTAADIAKSYIELEKELGKRAVSQKRLEELEQLREFIVNDKELVEAVQKKAGVATTTEPRSDDTRDALANKIVGDFEKDFGIDNLKAEDRQAMHEKIGQELADMLDPSGTMTTKELMASIKLDRLPKYLSKAYRLATIDDEREQARLKGLRDARQNSEATFGSIPSTGARSDSNTLNDQERATAKKLGISEEKYLEQKKKLAE